jgi:hypothetical protein
MDAVIEGGKEPCAMLHTAMPCQHLRCELHAAARPTSSSGRVAHSSGSVPVILLP